MSKVLTSTKYEKQWFAASDDSAITKQVQATHSPDGQLFDVKPVLLVIEDILRLAAPASVIVPPSDQAEIEAKTHAPTTIETLDHWAFFIHKVACELSCKCSGGSDAHATTMALFHSLSHFSWDSKMVLVLAAFAMSYGEFWLTAQLHTVNPLAKSIALLKHLPDVLEHVEALKPRFDALNSLIKSVIELTKCIIEFNDLPVEYISPDTAPMSMAVALIPTAIYWIVRSVVASSSQIIGLIGMSREYLSATSEAWELSSLAHKVNNIYGHLRKQLEACQRHVDEKKQVESYQILVHLFQTSHIDNMKILRTIFPSKDEMPLIHGAPHKKVNLDVLRRKVVLLLISDMTISDNELEFLSQVYRSTHYNQTGMYEAAAGSTYEVVWIPITDRPSLPWTHKEHEKNILGLTARMPWYTVFPPPPPNSAFVRYIKEEWHFGKKPILVVLDSLGKITNPNAIYMIYIWGALSFPFSSSREDVLWRGDRTLKLDFLVDEIDPNMSSWIAQDRYICLYGGEDIDWIRSFTSRMKTIMTEAEIVIEMVYVGKNHPKMTVKKNIEIIRKENLSWAWPFESIWFFWVRLDSMLHSKMQHQKSVANDQVMNEVMTLLAYGGSNEGWALICRGSSSDKMQRAQGKKVLDVLGSFDGWKEKVRTEGLVTGFSYGMEPYKGGDHCHNLVLPGDSRVIQEHVVCAECRRPMERYILYQCCDSQGSGVTPASLPPP